MNSKYTMLIDLDSCSGCHACSVACKAEHQVPIGKNRHTVQYVENGEFPHVTRNFIPTLCQHCTDAPCMEVCAVSAITIKESGAIVIDQEQCIGTSACVDACPYGAIYMDPTSFKAMKCDFCESRVEGGELPACAATCPTDAIQFAFEDDPKIQQALEKGKYTRWEPESTQPRVWYKGLDHQTESKLKRINHLREEK
ncbi:4Fe-4S dicluster domain-containing protein [Halobacillus naozhouensis]|uniref:4Fe-4S dicluster domain-containing protein n=1 Tax=Halobacillus naozhouensis TaxID=554880 RepID=A0ABY8IYQ2_9BACI|nr:4Fe-4S dicluster domain-containing protein [Halobacillus naozhouensis]WFT74502.1 4Fe-4S dicluster domain-containing protein [Halobacillus naozhouensis]